MAIDASAVALKCREQTKRKNHDTCPIGHDFYHRLYYKRLRYCATISNGGILSAREERLHCHHNFVNDSLHCDIDFDGVFVCGEFRGIKARTKVLKQINRTKEAKKRTTKPKREKNHA